METTALTATGREIASYLPITGQIIAGGALLWDAYGTYKDFQGCLVGH
jgi:hypothetical protein